MSFTTTLKFVKRHNQLAFLEKSEDNASFHEIVDFLNNSYIRFVLLVNPTIYESQMQNFWKKAKVKNSESGVQTIKVNMDGKLLTISESSIRRHLKFNDADGISQYQIWKFLNIWKEWVIILLLKISLFKRSTFHPNGDFSFIPSFIV